MRSNNAFSPLSRRRLFVSFVIALVIVTGLVHQLYFAQPAQAAISVFINEIHYDNTGTDAGEAIEIAGPAGTNLAGWSIVLYNGAGGAPYDTDALSGIIPNQQNGFGTVSLSYPSNGIQNGSPDGIALVNGTTVVQFLSYEGTFSAVGGPANGMVSTDIGVSENGTEPLGQSLRLTGSGQFYEDFTWNSPATATFGAVNTGQTFGTADAAPSVTNTSPTNGATGIAIGSNISVTFSESVNATTNSFTIECPTFSPQTFTLSSSPATTFTLDPTADLPTNTVCTVTVIANQISDADTNDPPDNMAADFVFSFTTADQVADFMIINELDSDTPGTDAAEFVELYDGGVGNTSLTGLVVVFYNGSNDLSYRAIDLDGFTTNASGYFTLGNSAVSGVDVTFPNNFLQIGEVAVALYVGNASSFPTNTPVTTSGLIDAIVYDTSDPDDPGLLVLLNAGQPQVDENSTGQSADVSNGRCPNGSGGQRNTTSYKQRVPTPDGANDCPPPPVFKTIPEIQGNGATSPFAGVDVITTGIVTARKSNGFFLQTTDADAALEGDPATSQGIFIFTSVAPPVTVGDSVTVTGTAG
ncbi:MAG TPA: Ig-like domain-containing protein, partial [Pyrinomonadaceae bacterium]|nr:Ig-like domain-containing protein [Pyrinomonadaceae bacterium]